MKLTLEIYRQNAPDKKGHFQRYDLDGLEPSMSILDALDILNDQLVSQGKEAVAFESDCREGICGVCGITVNSVPHGPVRHMTACHQRLMSFEDGQVVRLEPLRSSAFPVLKDLIVSRDALDDVVQSGAWVSVDAGTAPDADQMMIGADESEQALEFAACIGCGACVAACPNGSAHLFVGAKLAHLAILEGSQAERSSRARAMVAVADARFGPCSLHEECEKVCPQSIPITAVGAFYKERLKAMRTSAFTQ